jgi:hypothetical protein
MQFCNIDVYLLQYLKIIFVITIAIFKNSLKQIELSIVLEDVTW